MAEVPLRDARHVLRTLRRLQQRETTPSSDAGYSVPSNRDYLHLRADGREDLLELFHGVHVSVAVELGVDELAVHNNLERAGSVLRGDTLGFDARVLRLDGILHLPIARTVTCN